MLTGWITGAGLTAAVDSGNPVLRIGVGVMTGAVVLLPDADAPGSLFSKALPPLTTVFSWLVRHLSRIAYLTTKTPKDRKAEGTHRYLTHTMAWALACGSLIGTLLALAGVSLKITLLLAGTMFLGNLTHCLGDDMTESGVPLWWPIKIKGQRWYRCHLLPEKLRLTTGTADEAEIVKWIFVPASVLLIPGVWSRAAEVAAYGWVALLPLWSQVGQLISRAV